MSRHSPSTALLALGCLLTIYYIQHMFKQYFNFQLQRFVIVDPTTEPTITTLSPTTLRSTTVTATQTPTQPHAQSADLFYSFRGNSKHLYPQQHDNLFVGESKEEFTARFAQWQSRIHNLPFGGPQAHFSAWPVAFETPTLLVRSAFALTDVLYVSIALSKPPTAKRVWSLLPSTSWDNSPKLPFSSCKLVFMTHEGDEAIVANCTVNSNMSYNDRMLITLDRKYLDLDPNKQWVFSLVSGGKSFILPIERIPKRQEKQPNQVHFCTQGILCTFPPLPTCKLTNSFHRY